MRPFYETEKDRENEEGVAAFLAKKWNCDFEKLHPGLSLDYALLAKNGGEKNRKVSAILEVKCRQYDFITMIKMGGVMVSCHKWESGRQMSERFGIPFIIAVECKDVLAVSVFESSQGSEDVKLVIGGRSDRGDPADRTLCVLIPEERFLRKYYTSRLQSGELVLI